MSKVGNAIPFSMLLSAACATAPNYAVEPATGSTPEPQPTALAASPEASTEAAAVEPGALAAQDGNILNQVDVEKQRAAFLIERHLQNARSFIDKGELDAAEAELMGALKLDENNKPAQALLIQVSALMGKVPGRLGVEGQDFAARHAIRIQQMQAQARANYEEALVHLQRQDYERALAELSIARNQIRWAPYSIDWQGLDQQVEAKITEATQARIQGEQAAYEQKKQATAEALRAQAEAEKRRNQAIVANMLQQAIDAFERREYDDAIDFCDQALHADPRNEKATELRDDAFRAGRESVRKDYIEKKQEQFKRWREELAQLRIPESDIYTLPDQDFWADITAKRAKRRGIDMSQRESASDRALRTSLNETRIPGLKVADEESLSKVVDILRTFTGLPLVVDPAAESAATDAGAVFQFNLTTSLSVEQALNLIVEQVADDQVAWTVRHDAVLITTKAKARGETQIYNHDVQDLIFAQTEFIAPRIDRIRLLDDMEDEDGGGPFATLGEKTTRIEAAELESLIQENIANGTWDGEGVSMTSGEGFLVIVHTAEVQDQVRKFLNDLRRFGSSLVTIESKFMTVASNWLQDVGVDFRGLDNPVFPFKDMDDLTNGLEDKASRGLDNNGLGAASGLPSSGFFFDDGGDGDYKGRTENFFENSLGSALSSVGGITTQLTFLNDIQVSTILRAVEKSSDYQLINSQVLSVNNTQRAYVAVVNQQAYIQDFDVEVAQFQAVADPSINVLQEGVVLDVRPTIHHNRKYLTLEIQPTVAKVVSLRTFSSTLGGNTAPVEFQLPELEIQSVFTTAVIPDGGSILLGGLSNVRNIERRAEVPWLSKIPIVGFLLRNEGFSDENKSLMILIRAHITDVQEEIERLETRLR